MNDTNDWLESYMDEQGITVKYLSALDEIRTRQAWQAAVSNIKHRLGRNPQSIPMLREYGNALNARIAAAGRFVVVSGEFDSLRIEAQSSERIAA